MHDAPKFTTKRIVRPRKAGSRYYPVIAIQDEQVLTENDETYSVDDYISQLPSMGCHILAIQSSANFLCRLTDIYGADDAWQWKCSSREREIQIPESEEGVTVCQLDTIVHFFGWRDENRKNHRYNLCLDPVTFYGRSLYDLDIGGDTILVKLLRWATLLRDWCNDNQISIRPTSGGIGSQFLRDQRFYPQPRRKTPRKTNEVAREYLPGNYYSLAAQRHREYTGIYIDQRRAHHYHAQQARLPDANSLYAYGDFQALTEVSYDAEDFGSGFSGLLYGIVSEDKRFYFTSEQGYLTDGGHKLGPVIAAWGSFDQDTGLPKYAKWAESELDKHENAAWLKPILLSTYGVLAAKPRAVSFAFHTAIGGKPIRLCAGSRQLLGLLAGNESRKIEPTIANVLHRAIIEAATRTESIGLSEWLSWLGFRVLSIYADAVIIDADTDLTLPSLPEPWRVKDTLHHLKFINSQAFVSGEMTKLPGSITRETALAASMGTVGKAPIKPMWDALTGMRVQ